MAKWCKLFLLTVFAINGLLISIFAFSEEAVKASSEMESPPAEIILQYPIGEDSERPAIFKIFTHKGHAEDYDIACDVCHHVFEKGENVWKAEMPVQKCQVCHKASEMGVHDEVVTGLMMKKLITLGKCHDCHRSSSG